VAHALRFYLIESTPTLPRFYACVRISLYSYLSYIEKEETCLAVIVYII
jgi:hypothetical protein